MRLAIAPCRCVEDSRVSPQAIDKPQEAARVDAEGPNRFDGEDWTNRNLPLKADASRVTDEQ